MRLLKYSESQLREAVRVSYSKREVLLVLGLTPAGGNHQTLRKALDLFSLDTSHFKGQGWRKGRTFQPRRPIEVYLNNEFPIQSNKLMSTGTQATTD